MKYSIDEICINNLDNVLDLVEYFNYYNNVDFKGRINLVFGNKIRIILDYIFGFNNEDIGFRNTMIKEKIVYFENIRLFFNSY